MAKIPTILEAGRADGKLIKINSVYDDTQKKFLSDMIKNIDDNHNKLKYNVNTLTETVNNDKSDIESKLEKEKTRATNAESALNTNLEAETNRATIAEDNLRETINNITEINENATSANIVTIDPLPNSTASNVQQALYDLYKNIIYDVSSRNGGAVFESLSALLNSPNLSTLIPTSVRHGGMIIKFIQSSDNKYVQYMLMSDTWSLSPYSWQGVDNNPEPNSNNLVKSGGVANCSNVFNVNSQVEDIDYTLQTAIASVPYSWRRKGLFITFFNSTDRWTLAQYHYENPSSAASWENTDAWIVYATNIDISSIINSKEIYNVNETTNKIYTSFADARNDVPLDVRKAGIILTYQFGEFGNWRTEQLISQINVSGSSWSNDANWKSISVGGRQSIVVAAYDSSNEAKSKADFVFPNGSGIEYINNIITNYCQNGGRIYLLNGTYTGTVGIALTKSNVIIEGESLEVKIKRVSGNDIFCNNATIQGCIVKNISFDQYQLVDGCGVVFENCNINNNINGINSQRKVIRVPASDGIAGINAAINTMTLTYGGKIILDEGVYEGDTYINFTSRYMNITIEGIGKGTIIKRTTTGNDVIIPDEARNIIFKNLTLTNGFNQYPNRQPIEHARFIECYIDNIYINDAPEEKLYRINVGDGFFYDTLSKAYSAINNQIRIYPYNEKDYRWEIHIYGRVVETEEINFGYPNVDLIGHNSIVEFSGNKGVHANFNGSGLGGGKLIGRTVQIKNIKFLKTGCYSYWDEGVAVVTANGYKFINCIFENQSSSPIPFNQADNEGTTDTITGARRHGIVIDIFDTDDRYATEFHNCTAIGSPYGFQNTRGWYISFGSPKLFNCVGIGGGIGLYGHGIIIHRGSTPELHDCVGYGSKWGYNDNAGIRFQAMGQGTLVGCVGYGSNAKRYLSNGVSAARITEICTALSIDPSTYVVDGEVQYTLLTDKICAEITNDDINIQPTGVAGGKGVGISFWANNGSAKLIDCVGYAGNGQYSAGLELNSEAKPIIQGGYYGVEDRTYNFKWNSSNNYNLIKIDSPNIDEFTPLLITKINISLVGDFSGLTIHVIINDNVGKEVASLNLTGIASIGVLNVVDGELDANTGLVFYFTNSNGQTVQPPSSPYFHIGYCFNNNTRGLSLLESSHPKVDGATIKTDSTGSSVYINTDSNDYLIKGCLFDTYGGNGIDTDKTNIKMYDCCIKGSVDNSITFASKTAINGSSNYN